MPGAGLDDQVGTGDQRLGHGPAHLLLLGPVLATWHLGRDLVEPVDGVVARLPGLLGRPAGGAEDVELVEAVGLHPLVPDLLHAPIMPAGDDQVRPTSKSAAGEPGAAPLPPRGPAATVS